MNEPIRKGDQFTATDGSILTVLDVSSRMTRYGEVTRFTTLIETTVMVKDKPTVIGETKTLDESEFRELAEVKL